jgi:hypothetical protein
VIFKRDKQEDSTGITRPNESLLQYRDYSLTTLPDSPHEMSINELVNKLAIKKSEMEECKLINTTSGRHYKLWIY